MVGFIKMKELRKRAEKHLGSVILDIQINSSSTALFLHTVNVENYVDNLRIFCRSFKVIDLTYGTTID